MFDFTVYAQTPNSPDLGQSLLGLTVLVLSLLFGLVLFALLPFAFILFRRYQKREKRSWDYVLLQVKPTKYNEIKIEAAEAMFASFYGLFRAGAQGWIKGQDHIGFEIVSKNGEIVFYVSTPNELSDLVEKQIHSFYPEAEIVPVPDYTISTGKYTDIVELSLKAKAFKPIRRFKEFGEDVDPMNSITTALSKLEQGEAAALQILIAPAGSGWQGRGFREIHRVQTSASSSITAQIGKSITSPGQPQQPDLQQPEARTNSVTMDPYKKIEEKSSKPGFDTVIRFVVCANNKYNAEVYINNMIGSFAQFADPVGNGFRRRRWPWTLTKKQSLSDFVNHIMPLFFGKMILNTDELATVFHFPSKKVMTPNIIWALAKKSAAPTTVPSQGLYLGKSVFRGVETPIRITEDDRRRHTYIIGQTGTGKSELLKHLAYQDIVEGKGVAFIDPHGSAIEDLINMIPASRAEDVILFDAGDTERPLGLNILEGETDEQKNMVVNSFIALLYKLYDPKKVGIMGPRLERAIRNVMLTAMVEKGNTLVEVLRLLIDPKFVQEKLPLITDPLVRRYWTDEIAQTSDFHKSETMGYFVSKFDRFVTDKLLRNIVGQSQSAFDFRKLMDEGKILLVDLSKGKIGDENSNFLGLILVPRILIAAMSRIDVPEEQRRDFYLYVDEFQNFATPDFAVILSEARKYHLNLTVANQFIAQIEQDIKDAVFGNVGTTIAFRVGIDDATYLEHQFEPVFNKQDLINNPIGHAYIRLLVKGQPTPPFSFSTDWNQIQGIARNKETGSAIAELSRLRFGKDKNIVEAEINRRAELDKPVPLQKPNPEPITKNV
ncbi:MAG: TraM recognition domain-containing protein [bacterium]|nr:TraM recognition domain-containing protein [bacterium]